jgi:hypothetical protein
MADTKAMTAPIAATVILTARLSLNLRAVRR